MQMRASAILVLVLRHNHVTLSTFKKVRYRFPHDGAKMSGVCLVEGVIN